MKMNKNITTSTIMQDMLMIMGPVWRHIKPPWMDLKESNVNEVFLFLGIVLVH